jgi:Dyp-type peroxidase family
MISLDKLDTPITEEQRQVLRPVLESLQGNILHGHKRERAVHLFFRFQAGRQQEVRARLRDIARDGTVTSSWHQDKDRPGLFCSVFLSAAGYRYLDPRLVVGFSAEFQNGMKGARESLRDDPTLWEPDYAHDFHAMVLLACSHPQTLCQAAQEMQRHFTPVTDYPRKEEWGKVIRVNGKGVEHFRYADGISQPLFFQKDIERYRQQSALEWDPSAGPSLVLVPDPNGGEHDFGSYLVFRKLEQNVWGFFREVGKLANELGVDPNLAGAFAIGRFQDSTPVVLQDTDGRPDDHLSNFSFSSDPEGRKCPYHAHIRKLNPRDDVASARDRRIARRGITYGERAPDLSDLPAHGVGLLFMCFQRDIKWQFEFLQSRWANNTNFLRENTGVDPMIGHIGAGKPVPQKWPPSWGAPRAAHQPVNFGSFVTLRGGEYFFAPSINFLKNL